MPIALAVHSPTAPSPAISRVATMVISNLVLASGLLPRPRAHLPGREGTQLSAPTQVTATDHEHTARTPEPGALSLPSSASSGWCCPGAKRDDRPGFRSRGPGRAGWGQEGVRAFQIADHLGSDRAQWLRALELDKPESRPRSATSQLCDFGQVT